MYSARRPLSAVAAGLGLLGDLIDLYQGTGEPAGDGNRRGHGWRMEETIGFGDILVGLDTGWPARGRIELAAAVAERFAAHLIGLHTTLPAEAPGRRGYFDYFARSLLDPLYREYRQKMAAESGIAGDSPSARSGGLAGRRTVNRDPLPSRLSTAMSPR
jgi:hypothetical protein